MDIEILADERAKQRRFRGIYRVVTGAVLGAAMIGLVVAAFAVSDRSGWIVTLGLGAIIAVVGLMIWLLDRRHPNQLSSAGPWSHGQVYSGAQPKQIWNALGKVIVRHRLGFTRLTDKTAMLERPGSFLYRKGHHLLDVRRSEQCPGWYVITVQSAPDLPTTLTDFGRGRGINDELLAAVPGLRKPGDAELSG